MCGKRSSQLRRALALLLVFSLVASPLVIAEDVEPKPPEEMSSSELENEALEISGALKQGSSERQSKLEESKKALDESIEAQRSSEEKSAALEKEAKAHAAESSALKADLTKTKEELSALKLSLKNSDEEADRRIQAEKDRADRNGNIAKGSVIAAIVAIVFAIAREAGR